MCRSIKTLRGLDLSPTADEFQAAALQYVRKVTGYRKPSRVNQPAFDQAVAEIAAITQSLIDAVAHHAASGELLYADRRE